MTTEDRVFQAVMSLVVFGLLFASCRVGFDVGRSVSEREQATENDKCALRGLVLLRGQAGEYVCVVPGSERTRKP